ncbi:hypothetical protein Pla52o_51090 [Novipirellula galeiformis]|uniref:Uncharacterized protein n=1 Tax=Novipirellula galeiformis TaxID=2528004 RepID=A0A5C6BZ39_9BACT|nr:hypothetical protein Pla52o_51090 [Novipirellula galeiformis]
MDLGVTVQLQGGGPMSAQGRAQRRPGATEHVYEHKAPTGRPESTMGLGPPRWGCRSHFGNKKPGLHPGLTQDRPVGAALKSYLAKDSTKQYRLAFSATSPSRARPIEIDRWEPALLDVTSFYLLIIILLLILIFSDWFRSGAGLRRRD